MPNDGAQTKEVKKDGKDTDKTTGKAEEGKRNKNEQDQQLLPWSKKEGAKQRAKVKDESKAVRIVSQNIDNLGIDQKSTKSNEVCRVIGEDEADVWMIQEVGINWKGMKFSELWEERSRYSKVQRTNAVFAHNTKENCTSKFQPGGVGVILKNGMIGRKVQQGGDTRHLGRWTWVKIKGRNQKQVIFVSAYRPIQQQSGGINTVFSQQTRGLAQDGIYENPREAMLQDLARQIRDWHEQGIIVVVGMDANQNVQSSRMQDFADECDMIEAVTTNRTGLPKVATCIKNNNNIPIDGIWITASVSVLAAGYYQVGDKVSSDHLALWVDIAKSDLMGHPDHTENPCIRSLLNVDNFKAKKRYLSSTRKSQKACNTLDRLRKLDKITTVGWTQRDEQEYNDITSHDVAARRHIADHVRKKRLGRVPWSPMLQQLREERRLWFLIIKLRSGCVVKANQIRRLQQKLKIQDAFEIPIEKAAQRKQVVDKKLKQTDSYWLQCREDFLRQKDQQHAREHGIGMRSARKSRVGIEYQRRIGRIIAKMKGKKKLKVTNLTAQDDNGKQKILNTMREMEDACIQSNIKRFSQANGCEAVTAPWVKEIGFLAEKNGARDILDGTFETSGMSQYMREFVEELRMSDKCSTWANSKSLSVLDHQTAWRKQRAQTGSDTRGLSYAHFKVSAMDEDIAEVDCLCRRIPYQKGFSPLLWQQVSDFQLLKKAGVYDVDLMRTIQLYMADFNMNNKKLGRDVLRRAETIGYLPEELTGSRKNRMAATTILNKVLVNDLWRLKRLAAALVSTDAKSCYDRVIHWIAMLAMMKVDAPYEPLRSMFETIQKAVHSIAIEENLSRTSYNGSEFSPPLHGLGQGNGAAPSVWVMVSAIIIHMMRKRGHGVQFLSALTSQLTTVTGFMFVDDLDLIDSAPTVWSTGMDAVTRMQESVDRWVGGLRASGGKLVPEKSFWYHLDFKWVRSRWQYRASEEKITLSIANEEGQSCVLKKLHPSQARETLGIFSSMDGNCRAQSQKLRDLTKKVSSRYRHSIATPNEIWSIFLSTTMKAWDYPKIAIQLPRAQWDSILRLILPIVLNKAGLAKTFPSVVLFAPKKYHGLGLRNPWWDQYIVQIRSLCYELSNNTVTGSLFIQVIEQTKLEIGLEGPLHQMPWDKVCTYMTPSWMMNLFRFAHEQDIQIHEKTMCLEPRRKNDIAIMQLALGLDLTETELRRVNNVRQWIQVTFLSDICTLDGDNIHRKFWDGRSAIIRVCNDRWPRASPPRKHDLTLWRRVLASVTRSPVSLRLRTTLGAWLVPTPNHWCFSVQSGRLYRRCRWWWEEWTTAGIPQAGSHNSFQSLGLNLLGTEVLPPSDATAVDVQQTGHKVRICPSHHQVQPPVTARRKWWQDPRLVSRYVFFDETNFRLGLHRGDLRVVSDGSKKDHHGTSAFTVARTGMSPFLAQGMAVVFGPPEMMTPYRAELFGILSVMAWFEAQITRLGLSQSTVFCGCDNKTCVDHLLDTRPLSPQMADWDLLHSVKHAFRHTRVRWKFFWVRGHQDQKGRKLTQDEQLNVNSDSVAKQFWEATHQLPPPAYDHDLDTEIIGLYLGHQKLPLFDSELIYEHVILKEVRQHWEDRHAIPRDQWTHIYWKGLGEAMASVAPEIGRWHSKHLAGFSATGRVMFRRGEWTHHRCPVCDLEEEDETHAWFCTATLQHQQWRTQKKKMGLSLIKISTSPALCSIITQLFPPWFGSPPTLDDIDPVLQSVAEPQFRIGIPQLFCGRITQQWIDHQQRWLLGRATRWKKSPTLWARRLIKLFLTLSWDMWRFRTDYLHSDQHPWQESTRQRTISQIRALSGQNSLFLSDDRRVLRNLPPDLDGLSLSAADQILQTLAAAQLRKRAYDNSLQPERGLMRRWLTPQSGSSASMPS